MSAQKKQRNVSGVYEVLDGEAHFQLQHAHNEHSVDKVLLVNATKGDNVIIRLITGTSHQPI